MDNKVPLCRDFTERTRIEPVTSGLQDSSNLNVHVKRDVLV
jgi:hypothetical protein